MKHATAESFPSNDLLPSADVLGDYWPGIQMYYPPVKYAPALGLYEDLEQASQRFKKHAWGTTAHTLIFDLEDGCRQKEMSRELLRRELPNMPKRKEVQVAIRINPFRTAEYEKDSLCKCAAQKVQVCVGACVRIIFHISFHKSLSSKELFIFCPSAMSARARHEQWNRSATKRAAATGWRTAAIAPCSCASGRMWKHSTPADHADMDCGV